MANFRDPAVVARDGSPWILVAVCWRPRNLIVIICFFDRGYGDALAHSVWSLPVGLYVFLHVT